MKEISIGAVRVIRDSLRVAEQALTSGVVSPSLNVTRGEAQDTIKELERVNTSSDEDYLRKIAEMVLCAKVMCFGVQKGCVNKDFMASLMYDYTLDEYRDAVRRLGLPVGGEE